MTTESQNNQVKLDGIYAFKLGMSTIFNEKGEALPVTVLKSEGWVVTQIKSKEKDGYTAVQISTGSKKLKRATDAEKGHFSKAGFETAPTHTVEIRQELPEGVSLGQKVSLESLSVGDVVKATSKSKGRGFAGVVKRYGFAGGPASHGSGFHRAPGSSGCRTWPGRIMPGKRFPGQYGNKNITVKGLEIVGVVPEENVLFVKGSVPGAANTLVRLMKE